jgi:hypothetical protein
LPVRLKLDNMDPKCYSAACWCNVRFGLCDHLCNPLYLLLMAMAVVSTTLCKSQQWFWDCDGLHNGHFEFIINLGVLLGAGEPVDPAPIVPTVGVNWRGFNPAMPILEGFRFMKRMWVFGGFDGFRQKQGYTRIYPGSPSRRVKIYILPIWSCIACIVGAVTMVRRWDLAEVEGDGVASLSTWDLCEIRCLCEIRDPLLGRPSSPLYGGRDLGIRSKSVTGVCEP